MKTLNYYAGLANECIKQDKPKMDLYAKIDLHRLGQWKPSTTLSKLPWIQGRNFSSTAPADALDAGTRTFASLMPKVNIAPLSEEMEEYEDAERKETALEWHFKRMNMSGRKTTHWQIMESAMRYCAVAFETEYLPFSMKGRENEPNIKALLRRSSFRWTVHHPATVHPRYSKNGLECVCLVKVVNFQEMYDEFGKNNKGIRKIVQDMFKGEEPKYEQMLLTYFTYCKVTDWKETCIWLSPNGGSRVVTANLSGTGGYELLHEEHGLDFIPWVVTDNEDPIRSEERRVGKECRSRWSPYH